ncbi:MAG: iron ABC transporter permease [Ruminococcus sp.]|nr:iron ABC transporter permease [Ruminococcus sp.]MBR6385912.1 iron ABC transporter permease [Ruminococcus sp.]
MNKKSRYAICFLILIILYFFLIFLNLIKGSTNINISDDSVARNIVMNIRLPRTLAAAILGGALAVSGFLLQNFFSNPIAGPFVLGISSGAKLIVALSMIFTLSMGIASNSFITVSAAFVGSMMSMGFILLISGKIKNVSLLIIAGVMTGYICNSITELAVTFADDSNIVNLHNWSVGTFSGTDMEEVYFMSAIVIPCVFFTFMLSKPLSAFQLGEAYAESMGVNIKLFRFELILLSSILSACVTAFAGPVSFLGVAVPHIIKGMFRTAKPIIIIPAVFLGGGVMCLFCDLIARTLFSPTELSISTVTAIFGAPVVILIMIRRKRG